MKRKNLDRCYRRVITTAALAAAAQAALPARAGQNTFSTGTEVTISTSGSTALKNWFVKNTNTFTDVTPGTQLIIGGTTYPSNLSTWNSNGGSAFAYQLAPAASSPTAGAGAVNSGPAQQADAIRFEYHESGSVEGLLELANDQIGTVQFVTDNIDRNPTLSATSGNNVWVNYQQYGSGKGAWTGPAGSSVANGLGNFYPGTSTFVAGSASNPTPSFDLAGNNTSVNAQGISGQNAVQMAVSDVLPVQAFVSTPATDSAAHPWLRTPTDAGYGTGNTALPSGNLGSANTRAVFQSTSALNMPATAINPRTGAAFGNGAWNTSGLNNVNSQLVAVTATLFVANPGTGLTQLNRTDAQWLQLQGRLQNGATFNMTTRDVNSGTRNVAALETGIDPTWAVGLNDNGNGNNSASGGTSQISVGPGIRFSNKTAGGGELRPTVQSARMAIGTLSINDANGSTFNDNANPLRALSYSNVDSNTDGSRPASTYVAASYASIINGTYTIFQNEQFATLKAADSTYANANASNINVQGDTNVAADAAAGGITAGNASGDVRNLINNTLSSIANDLNAGKPASPAAGLMNQGYILPQLMQVRKNFDGGPIVTNDVAHGAIANQAFNPSAVAASSLSNPGEGGKMANADPSVVTSGSGSSVYGGNTVNGTGVPSGGTPFTSPISLTPNNYLFGNFNQTGVRDLYSSVVLAQKAQAALQSSGNNESAFAGSSNSVVVPTGVSALDTMAGQTGDTINASTNGGAGASKGDLIVLGDYNGDGAFNGKDLYSLAFGAALADAGNAPVFTGSGAATTYSSGGTISGGAATFSQKLPVSVLYKNAAMNYLNNIATTSQKTEAQVTISVNHGASAPTYAGVAANLVSLGSAGGQDVYTLDNGSGQNAFNPADVNHDGQINLDDAFIVDKFAGKSYTSQVDQQLATIGVDGTTNSAINQQPLSLVAATLVDYGSNDPAVNKIQQGDQNVVNAALTGAFNYAWYGGVTKTGALNISIAPVVGSKFQVPAGTTFTISSGGFTAGGTADPFTDNSGLATNGNHLNIVNNAALTIAGGAKVTGAINNGAGPLAGTTTVATGASLTAAHIRQDTLAASGTVTIAPQVGPRNTAATVSIVNQLNVAGATDAWTGKLDLTNNDLIIHGGNLAQVSNQLKAGLNLASPGGYWNGAGGIVSSTAAADSTHLTTLGVIQNNDGSGNPIYGATTAHGLFDGQNPGVGDVLVKYTYFGDADLSGTVDGTDYAKIDNGFVHNLTGWFNGDFNHDGVIDGSDYSLIDNAFNNQGASLAGGMSVGMLASNTAEIAGGAAAVPEPGTLSLALLASATLLKRRRRSC